MPDDATVNREFQRMFDLIKRDPVAFERELEGDALDLVMRNRAYSRYMRPFTEIVLTSLDDYRLAERVIAYYYDRNCVREDGDAWGEMEYTFLELASNHIDDEATLREKIGFLRSMERGEQAFARCKDFVFTNLFQSNRLRLADELLSAEGVDPFHSMRPEASDETDCMYWLTRADGWAALYGSGDERTWHWLIERGIDPRKAVTPNTGVRLTDHACWYARRHAKNEVIGPHVAKFLRFAGDERATEFQA